MSEATTPVNRIVAVLSHPEEVRIALPWAAMLAREWKRPLTLLHIIDPVTSTELSDNARAMADDMLALLTSSPLVAGLEVETRVESGMPEQAVPRIAQELPGCLLVLSAGEHGVFARALLGRGRENIIHYLRTPFFFLPPHVGAAAPIRRAVAGVDGSGVANTALGLAEALASGVEITQVSVVEPGDLPVKEFLAVTPAFSHNSIRMRGRAEVALLAAARSRDAGLIVVGAHGAGGLTGRHLGGTAAWLSHHASRPVLIVPE